MKNVKFEGGYPVECLDRLWMPGDTREVTDDEAELLLTNPNFKEISNVREKEVGE